MKLRVIAGLLRGRQIVISDKIARFRPTKDRVRQSITESIKSRIVGAKVADLCCGSGAFGIECLSRGALEAHFIEHDRVLNTSIFDHCSRFGIDAQARIITQDVGSYVLDCKETFDIIFYDPPYADSELAGLIPKILLLLASDGILLYEHASKSTGAEIGEVSIDPTTFSRESRIYGDTQVDFYTRRIA